MSKINEMLNSLSTDDKYIHCADAMELLRKETQEEDLGKIATLLLRLFFHIEMSESSYQLNETYGAYALNDTDRLHEEDTKLFMGFISDKNNGCPVVLWNIDAIRESIYTLDFLYHTESNGRCDYWNFEKWNQYNLYWLKSDFFTFCKHYNLIGESKSDNDKNPSTPISLSIGKETEGINKIPEQVIEQEETIRRLKFENESLQTMLENTISSGKSARANMNIIGALLGVSLSNVQLSNQSDLINHLLKEYDGYTGISKSQLENVFAQANKYLADPK